VKRAGSPAALAAGIAVIVIGNAVVLGAAAWNRSGGARTELSLTERELAMPAFRQEENTGLFLSLVLAQDRPSITGPADPPESRLVVREPDLRHPRLDWLDRDKLGALGFNVDLDPEDPRAPRFYASQSARQAFLALEMDGDAWHAWLASLGDEATIEAEQTTRSRLFAIDADSDAGALRRRLAGRPRCVVVPCDIHVALAERTDRPRTLTGLIDALPARDIFVPRELRARLEPFMPRRSLEKMRREAAVRNEPESPALKPPRYQAALAFGRRLEPWLAGVEAIP
jgi:hypothetical protein